MVDLYRTDPKTGKRQRRGKKKRATMTKFRIDSVDLVDSGSMADQPIVLAKRDADAAEADLSKVMMSPKKGESRKDFVSRFMADEKMRGEFPKQAQRAAVANTAFRRSMSKADDGTELAKRAALTTSVDGHAHLISLDYGSGELTNGTTSYTQSRGEEYHGHSHPWVMAEDGSIKIGQAEGHTHRMDTMSKAADGVEADPDDAGNDTADSTAGGTMTTKKQDGAATKTADEQIADLTKRNERLELLGSLSDAEKVFFKSLEKAGAEAFLALDAAGRAGELAKADAADPVVYTSEVDGTVYRKSDDQKYVKLAMRLDKSEKTAAKDRTTSEQLRYEKRAEDELEHHPGTVEVRAAMLKAIDGIEDEEIRKAALQSAHAQSVALSPAFDRVGTNAKPVAGSAEEKLDALAKARSEKNGTTFEKAYDEVLGTPEGADLYNESMEASPR